MAGSRTLGVRIPENVLVSLDQYAQAEDLTRSKAIAVLVEKALQGERLGTTASTMTMTSNGGPGQNTASGQRAQLWGTQTARKIADVLGAEKAGHPMANEFLLDGKRIAIKCAKIKTTQCGLTNTMRDRVEYIVCAVQTTENRFNLHKVTPKQWKEHANEPPEHNRNHLYLTHLSRPVFQRIGDNLGEVEIEE